MARVARNLNFTTWAQAQSFKEIEGIISLDELSWLLDNITLTKTGRMFALDLRGVGKESVLWVDGIDEAYRGRMTWDAMSPRSLLRAFPISAFEMCGVELMAPNETARLTVDTKSPCLSLPWFKALVSLLPLECVKDVCTLPKNVAPRLPTVSFRSMEGDLFVISLNDLFINSTRQLCIREGLFTLGTLPLRSLFVAFAGKAVGLSNKIPAVERSNMQCPQKIQCKGMQEVFPEQNICLDPPCDDYYFYQLDHIDKVCVFSGTFHALAVGLLALFIIVEFVLYKLEVDISRKVVEAYPL